jgi:hypothetical protein
VYSMREVGPGVARWGRMGASRGGVQDAPKGPRPEKVKYPGMREASIVKPMYNYSFKLYIGTLYRLWSTYLHTYISLSIMQT